MPESGRIVAVRLGFALALALVTGAVCAPAGQAAVFTVDNTTDAVGSCPTPTTCSLRQALAGADAAAGSDAVAFNLPAGSVISLTNGPLGVAPGTPSDAVAIRGPGAASLTVRRDPTAPPSPVFFLVGGSGVTMSGFTISGGRVGQTTGAAINSFTTLVLDRMVITGNTADANNFGTGGGIVVTGSTTIRSSTLHGNTVTNAGPGHSGGAIVNAGALLVVNSTITDNHVTGPGPQDGGAIWNLAFMTLVNTTISGNSAVGGGGGVYGDPFAMANSILAGNSASPGPDCNTALTSSGYNVIGSPTGCTISAGTGDQVGTPATTLNPLLGPLAANGGPTPTTALLAGSPALDAGNSAVPSDAPAPLPPDDIPCASADQRGVVRPVGSRCDVGAFEFVPPVPPLPAPTPVPPPVPVAPAPPIAPPPFVAPPVDPFKCYGADEIGFERRSVRMRDQFTTGRTTSLRKTTLVCNPAHNIGATSLQPKAHLVCYQSRDGAPFKARSVSVTNQFGTRVLRVTKAVSLCVPSLKRLGGSAPGTSPDPQKRLDHFRCYAVDPKQTPRTVRLADQFVTTRTNTVSVVRVCNPVSKNGGAVRKPGAHLVCYSIRDLVASKVRAVTVRNQFGVARLSVARARTLCVPSLKRDLGAAAGARNVRGWGALR